MIFKKLIIALCAVGVLCLSACDLGLDYRAASTYCRDQYTFVGEQLERLESSQVVQQNFKEDTEKLISEPLKMCYMAGFICNLKCYNLDAGCHDAFYEAHKYCATTPTISKSIK